MQTTVLALTLTLLTACGCNDAAEAPPPPSDAPPPITTPEPGREVGPVKAPPHGGQITALPNDGAAVADPDRDIVWLLDGPTAPLRAVHLPRGSQPFRGAVGGRGDLFVTLRGRLQGVVKIDVASATAGPIVPVCAEPRGITYTPALDRMLVACAGDEVVDLDEDMVVHNRRHLVTSGRTLVDFRDVIVVGTKLFVTSFATAEVYIAELADLAAPITVRSIPQLADGTGIGFTRTLAPAVAWHAIPFGDGIAIAHQFQQTSPVELTEGERRPTNGDYGAQQTTAACDPSIVVSAVSLVPATGAVRTFQFADAIIPADVAPDRNGNLVVALAASFATLTFDPRGPVGCTAGIRNRLAGPRASTYPPSSLAASSVTGLVFTYVRNPPTLFIDDAEIPLETAEVPAPTFDIGEQLLERPTPANVTCASCHPEGGQDGHVWRTGLRGVLRERRTPGLWAGVTRQTILHWDDEFDFNALMVDFGGRVGAGSTPDEIRALKAYLDELPPLRSEPVLGFERDLFERGRAVFASRCAGCHDPTSGYFSNGSMVVVHGDRIKVPPLSGLSSREKLTMTGRLMFHERFTGAPDVEHHFDATSPDLAPLSFYVRRLYSEVAR